MNDIFVTNGGLNGLHQAETFGEKIALIHRVIQRQYPFIDRVAAALYDEDMALLKTFIHSSKGNPLPFYECRIEKAPSLHQLMKLKTSRLVNDLSLFKKGKNDHTKRVADFGYRSSYTVPMFDGLHFIGVVFFNARKSGVFKKTDLPQLNLFAQLINSLILNKLHATRMLIGTFKSALEMVSYKDPETGFHLERMARYARLIARELARAGDTRIDDEMIEHVFLFAPLHDIGKIGIPDHILLKPDRLDAGEWEIMQTHSAKGRRIIDTIAKKLGVTSFAHIRILQNISESHHETIDGKGYPNRLKNNEIAIETQIVTVADIFDALTSERPYKHAWTNAEALSELNRLSGVKLNKACVDALMRRQDAVIRIQKRFQDSPRPHPGLERH